MLLRMTLAGAPVLALLASTGLEDAPPVAPTTPSSNVCSLQDDAPAYVGEKSCKLCHFKQHKAWGKTKMANAFDTLKPGNKADIKKAHGLDPEKDYTKDPSCLPCHTTGYGMPGGYPKVDGDKKWTDEVAKLASEREGVQCESCHGPASKLMDTKKEIKTSKREYTTEELAKLGLVLPDAKSCAGCHNEKSPTHDPKKPFDFKKASADEKQIHDHVELKQRKS